MRPEEGKLLLHRFFQGLVDSAASIDTTAMSSSGTFTDLQLKRVELLGKNQTFYCLNFALVTEDEGKRREAQALLSTINQVIGRRGPGYQRTRPKYRLYSGNELLAETK